MKSIFLRRAVTLKTCYNYIEVIFLLKLAAFFNFFKEWKTCNSIKVEAWRVTCKGGPGADCKKITHSREKNPGELRYYFQSSNTEYRWSCSATLLADKYMEMLLTILTQILLTRTWSFSIYEMKHTR